MPGSPGPSGVVPFTPHGPYWNEQLSVPKADLPDVVSGPAEREESSDSDIEVSASVHYLQPKPKGKARPSPKSKVKRMPAWMSRPMAQKRSRMADFLCFRGSKPCKLLGPCECLRKLSAPEWIIYNAALEVHLSASQENALKASRRERVLEDVDGCFSYITQKASRCQDWAKDEDSEEIGSAKSFSAASSSSGDSSDHDGNQYQIITYKGRKVSSDGSMFPKLQTTAANSSLCSVAAASSSSSSRSNSCP
jgi:hypothetical protein